MLCKNDILVTFTSVYTVCDIQQIAVILSLQEVSATSCPRSMVALPQMVALAVVHACVHNHFTTFHSASLQGHCNLAGWFSECTVRNTILCGPM
jgi:hypothetical protein